MDDVLGTNMSLNYAPKLIVKTRVLRDKEIVPSNLGRVRKSRDTVLRRRGSEITVLKEANKPLSELNAKQRKLVLPPKNRRAAVERHMKGSRNNYFELFCDNIFVASYPTLDKCKEKGVRMVEQGDWKVTARVYVEERNEKCDKVRVHVLVRPEPKVHTSVREVGVEGMVKPTIRLRY
jgi:hypothetical protein